MQAAVDDSLTMDRAFVPAAGSHSAGVGRRGRMFLAEDRARSYGQALRERTLSEGEKIKRQIGQVDARTIKQGQGLAIGAISTTSSFDLEPLRDLQVAERLNAINGDA